MELFNRPWLKSSTNGGAFFHKGPTLDSGRILRPQHEREMYEVIPQESDKWSTWIGCVSPESPGLKARRYSAIMIGWKTTGGFRLGSLPCLAWEPHCQKRRQEYGRPIARVRPNTLETHIRRVSCLALLPIQFTPVPLSGYWPSLQPRR